MQAPLFVRPLTDTERTALETGRHSGALFTVRRCQILLASARQLHPPAIAQLLGCHVQTVRNAIHAFARDGVAALTPGSSRPHTIHAAFAAPTAEQLRDLLHRSPRDFGHPTSIWTLELAAEVSFSEGVTATRVSDETIRATLARLGIGWRRAKQWITSPDPAYQRKKGRRDRLLRLVATQPTWALGFEDEVWWSRLAQPHRHAWAEADAVLRLVEQAVAKADPDPKALACYGLLVRGLTPETDAVWLRFVSGRPVSGITTQFLAWCSERLAAAGRTALLLVWDNASWHRSRAGRTWLRTHNRQVKQTGVGVRILSCFLPSKSPWLNPIEPQWVHAKRAVVEPTRLLTGQELADRVCAYFGCTHEDHLTMAEKVA